MRDISYLIPAASAASIVAVYLDFLYTIGQSGILLRATFLEGTILVLQLGRLLGFVALRDWRNAKPMVVLNVFGAEIFTLPVWAVLYHIQGDTLFLTIMYQTEFSWFLGVSIAATPVVTYRVLRSMLQRNPLVNVLPAVVILLQTQLVLLATADNLTAIQSPMGFGVDLLLLATGRGPLFLSSPATLVAFSANVLGYVSLLAYATTYTTPGLNRRVNMLLAVSVVVTLGTCAAVLGSRALTASLALLLAPPTVLLSVSTWWFSRAK